MAFNAEVGREGREAERKASLSRSLAQFYCDRHPDLQAGPVYFIAEPYQDETIVCPVCGFPAQGRAADLPGVSSG